MPYVEIPQDDVSLYWRSNLPNDDLSYIRSNPKPVILLLHPLFMCTDFLDAQFTDPLLVENFHLIAFDSVSYGHTKNPRYMSQVVHHDAWVEGAIIARFCDALDLPPVRLHIPRSCSKSHFCATRSTYTLYRTYPSMGHSGLPCYGRRNVERLVFVV